MVSDRSHGTLTDRQSLTPAEMAAPVSLVEFLDVPTFRTIPVRGTPSGSRAWPRWRVIRSCIPVVVLRHRGSIELAARFFLLVLRLRCCPSKQRSCPSTSSSCGSVGSGRSNLSSCRCSSGARLRSSCYSSSSRSRRTPTIVRRRDERGPDRTRVMVRSPAGDQKRCAVPVPLFPGTTLSPLLYLVESPYLDALDRAVRVPVPQFESRWNLTMAASVMFMVPVIILFFPS